MWVGEVTYRHVAEQFAWTRLGEVADTKRDTVVRLYSPVAAVPTPAEHAVGGLRVPLVGRGAELVALTAAIVRLQAGIGGVVTVVGEAGIGKSRLIAEARSRAIGDDASDNAHRAETSSEASDRTSALRWVEGQWLSYTEGTAYYGWQELLRRLLGLSESCTLATCEALEEEVRAHCPDRADEITPYLRRLLALPEDAETADSLDRLVPTGMLRNAIFQAVTTLLTSVARRVPLVAVLDDLHWADGASLALLEHVLALTDQVPMLVIIAMRPARTHGSWHVRETAMREYGHRHTDLSLGPLQPTESEALVRSYLQAGGRGSGVDVNLVRQVQQRAEGNPFFAAEIVRSLVDEGAMIERPPATIEGVLTARIDRLPLEARRVLQLAAVMGRIFSYDLLLDIVSGEEPGFREGLLNGALLELLRAQLIREHAGGPDLIADRPPDREFIFEHQLTLEAAYRSLLQRKRRVLHRRVAEAQERLYPEQTEAQLGLLAYHWEQAGDLTRAVDYLQRAGRQAASQYANDEALLFFSRALSLVPNDDDETRYALLLARERVYNLIGDRRAQTKDLESLTALADRAQDTHKMAEVLDPPC